MKKILLLSSLILSCFVINIKDVNALAVDYEVEKVVIDAYINEDGSMDVAENFILTGSFNGYWREIIFKNSSNYDSMTNFDYLYSPIYGANSLELNNVKDLNFSGELNYYESYEFEQTSYGTLGDVNVFEFTSYSNKIYLKMYNYTNNGTNGFQINYTLEDVVVTHEDVAEILWTFIGEDFEDELHDLTINLYLPGEDEEMKAWAHGQLNGEIILNNNNNVLITVTDLIPGSAVDARVVFDKSLLDDYSKDSNVSAIDGILEVEAELAEEANKYREYLIQQEIELQEFIEKLNIFNYFLLVTSVLLLTYNYYKNDKDFTTNFNHKYYRDILPNYTPSKAQYILKKNVSESALSATMLEIIRKKGILIKDGTKKGNEIFVVNKPSEELSLTEIFVKEWFVGLGSNGEFTMKDLKNTSKTRSGAAAFLAKFNKFKKMEITDTFKTSKYLEQGKWRVIFSLLSFFVFSVSIVNLIYINFTLATLFLFLLSTFILIYAISFQKRTKEGQEDYKKWRAFKKYLLDFGRLDEKELPHISLWEEYLVYATALGCARKVEKAMKIKIKDFDETSLSTSNLTFLYLGSSNLNVSSALSTSIDRSLKSAIASSQPSSSGGGGGGFSSGGGFGGGGGGGGGF